MSARNSTKRPNPFNNHTKGLGDFSSAVAPQDDAAAIYKQNTTTNPLESFDVNTKIGGEGIFRIKIKEPGTSPAENLLNERGLTKNPLKPNRPRVGGELSPKIGGLVDTKLATHDPRELLARARFEMLKDRFEILRKTNALSDREEGELDDSFTTVNILFKDAIDSPSTLNVVTHHLNQLESSIFSEKFNRSLLISKKVPENNDENKEAVQNLFRQRLPFVTRYTALVTEIRSLKRNRLYEKTNQELRDEVENNSGSLSWLETDPTENETIENQIIASALDALEEAKTYLEKEINELNESERISRTQEEEDSRKKAEELENLRKDGHESSILLAKLEKVFEDFVDEPTLEETRKASLLKATQDLLDLRKNFEVNSSPESLKEFKDKIGEYEAVIKGTLEELAEKKKALEALHSLDVWSGWPREIKEVPARPAKSGAPGVERHWIHTGDGGVEEKLNNTSEWSKAAENFSHEWLGYLSFFKGEKTLTDRKVKEYSSVIKTKNGAVVALMQHDLARATVLLGQLREELTAAEESWKEKMEKEGEAERKAKETLALAAEKAKLQEAEQKTLAQSLGEQNKRFEEESKRKDSLLQRLTSDLAKETLVRRFQELAGLRDTLQAGIPTKSLNQNTVTEYQLLLDEIHSVLDKEIATRDALDERAVAGAGKKVLLRPISGISNKTVLLPGGKKISVEEWHAIKNIKDSEAAADIAKAVLPEASHLRKYLEINNESDLSREKEIQALYKIHQDLFEKDKERYYNLFVYKEWGSDDPNKKAVEKVLTSKQESLESDVRELNFDYQNNLRYLESERDENEKIRIETLISITKQSLHDKQNELDELLKIKKGILPDEVLKARALAKSQTNISKDRSLKSSRETYSPASDPASADIGTVRKPDGIFNKLNRAYDAARQMKVIPGEKSMTDAELEAARKKEVNLSDKAAPYIQGMVRDITPEELEQAHNKGATFFPMQGRSLPDAPAATAGSPVLPVAPPSPAAPTPTPSPASAPEVSASTAAHETPEPKERSKRVQSLFETLLKLRTRDGKLKGWKFVIGAITLAAGGFTAGALAQENKANEARIETLVAQNPLTATSWRDFPEVHSHEMRDFIKYLTGTSKLDFFAMIRLYGSLMKVSVDNPSTIQAVSVMDVSKLLSSPEPVYGINNDQRAQLCTLITKFQKASQAAEAARKNLGSFTFTLDTTTRMTLEELYNKAVALVASIEKEEEARKAALKAKISQAQ